MRTNEERREVARRLRGMAPGSDWPKYVAEACGMDVSKMSGHFHTYTAQLCQRLADLIEPEPERTCTVSSWHYEKYGDLSDVVLISYELSCGHGDDGFSIPKYCPNCGAMVIRKDR